MTDDEYSSILDEIREQSRSLMDTRSQLYHRVNLMCEIDIIDYLVDCSLLDDSPEMDQFKPKSNFR